MAPSPIVLGPPSGIASALAADLDASLAVAEHPLPANVTGVVIVAEPPPARAEVTTLRGDDWHRLVDAPMWRTLTALQRARSALLPAGGRIVVVVPTIGMSGATGLVGYTTALEGIRAMAKSAARQWASAGIGVNLVAVPLSAFSGEDDAAAGHLTVPAVPDATDLVHTAAESIRFLLRTDIAHLAGETIVADGGSVMLP
ncbi:hypothetical protein MPRF_11590 [Mycolicibacterium parafortuitum]|uniref:Uncharacterized protein n=1 Tax=Mycolicibacterium parafortuitum TaxID=39692 RepID=A0A7I7TYP0_MYCPF|nr:SDR family oxidoreductase [Mycolicibacterium parafortuitum]BBY74260.1 hypothetical protein MPRF_11590 [Mycolicibacterium parafortuitum]